MDQAQIYLPDYSSQKNWKSQKSCIPMGPVWATWFSFAPREFGCVTCDTKYS